MANNIVLL